MNTKENKKLIISIVIIVLIISIVGGSLAYWSWQSSEEEKTLVSVSVQGATLTIEGGNVEKTGMYPTNDCAGAGAMIGEVATATAVNGTATDMEVLLKIRATLSVSQGSLTKNQKGKINWALVDTSAGTTCSTTTYKGTLSDVTTNTDIDTGTRFIATKNATTTKSYRIYVWLDSTYTYTNSGDTISDPMQNLSISVKFSPASELSQEFHPAVPVLDSGMIPVTIANDGTVKTISTSNADWYDYSNKEWANAVLVKQEATENTTGSYSREYYKNNPGTTVLESDILAYYVWIPRYKYKIWTLTTGSSPQTIDIVFESGDAEVTSGSQVGDYITHPAFVWDGTTIAGIWVGKFETTGDGTTPTIKPNTSSLISQNVSTQFTTSLKFAGGILSNGNVTFDGNNKYGLIQTTDSHMMKNSEWGAVAYLSHSQYGINSEIRINNNSVYTTGCGASEENGSSTSECQISYGSGVTSYPQSTTGNITGIFDMSGGADEYVMGVYSDSTGKPMSGLSSTSNSGFNGLIGDGTTYSSGISFPESKYYDLYLSSQFSGDTGTNMSLCTLETCGGQSLHETAGWYGDAADFVSSEGLWFLRSGYYFSVPGAGAFFVTTSHGGYGYLGISWRSVLVVDGA